MADAPGSPKAPEAGGAIESAPLGAGGKQAATRFKPGNKIGPRFKPGKSGNPTGLNKLAAKYKAALEQGLPPEALKRVVDAIRLAAESGDMTAAKMVLDRTVGPLADAPKVSVNVLNLVPAAQSRNTVSLEDWKDRAQDFKDAKGKP